MSATQVTFKCPLCGDFEATQFRLLLPHIRLVHSTRPGFTIKCFIENCSRIFKNMKTYTNHIYGDHECLPRTARDYQCLSTQAIDLGEWGGCDQEFEEDRFDTNALPPEFESIAACWILNIKECCKLTQSATEDILARVTDLNQYILLQVFQAVKTIITNAGVDIRQVEELQRIFDPNGKFGRPFKGLESSYKLQNYCKKTLELVVCYTYINNHSFFYVHHYYYRSQFLLSWGLPISGRVVEGKDDM